MQKCISLLIVVLKKSMYHTHPIYNTQQYIKFAKPKCTNKLIEIRYKHKHSMYKVYYVNFTMNYVIVMWLFFNAISFEYCFCYAE